MMSPGAGRASAEAAAAPSASSEPGAATVIESQGVSKEFVRGGGILASVLGKKATAVQAVKGVDLAIHEHEVFGLVGESGSGKSTLGMTLVKLYEPTEGRILFRGREITHLTRAGLKEYRRNAQIIFQDPYSSLNPRLTVGQIVEEPLKIHGVKDQRERAVRVINALEQVRVPPAEYLHRHPHELSGGLRQRVAIARTIVLEPSFIVADEPVSMLDVSVQAGILELLESLSRDMGVAVLYVSHDIATVRYICQRVAVMYLGQIVEYGDTEEVVSRPTHPYTQRLMAAVPSVDPTANRPRVEIATESDSGGNAMDWFAQYVQADDRSCGEPGPHWIDVSPRHAVSCHLHGAPQ
jgi:oligopeptide/dipeptide ABC transporter ATP-binding protein